MKLFIVFLIIWKASLKVLVSYNCLVFSKLFASNGLYIGFEITRNIAINITFVANCIIHRPYDHFYDFADKF